MCGRRLRKHALSNASRDMNDKSTKDELPKRANRIILTPVFSQWVGGLVVGYEHEADTTN